LPAGVEQLRLIIDPCSHNPVGDARCIEFDEYFDAVPAVRPEYDRVAQILE
jgi:hypothetical protein